jgi:hypothetical protein
VIAAMGGPYRRGRVVDRNGDELLGALQADLMPHVHAVRHLLPLLQDNVHARRYVMIGSPANGQALGRLRRELDHRRRDAHVRAGGAPGSAGDRRARADAGSLQPVCTPANAANACIEWPSSLLVGRRVVSLLDGRDNRAIVRCDSSDAELPRGLLHLEVPPLWRDTAGVA